MCQLIHTSIAHRYTKETETLNDKITLLDCKSSALLNDLVFSFKCIFLVLSKLSWQSSCHDKKLKFSTTPA